jgi:hypothetical protein
MWYDDGNSVFVCVCVCARAHACVLMIPCKAGRECMLMMLETVRDQGQKVCPKEDFSLETLTNEPKTAGLLELVLDGPWSCFKCRFVGQLEGAGSYFDIDLSGDDESDVLPIAPPPLAPPDASKILGKKVYFEFSSGAESELSLVSCYARELEVKGVWEETYEHFEQGTEESDKEHEAGGRHVKIHVFRVQVALCAAWEIEKFPMQVGDASGTMHKCVKTEVGFHLHVKNLTIDGSLDAPDFKYKHQQVGFCLAQFDRLCMGAWVHGCFHTIRCHLVQCPHSCIVASFCDNRRLQCMHAQTPTNTCASRFEQVDLKYNVFAISSLFNEDQVAALNEPGTTCKCWYSCHFLLKVANCGTMK